MKFNTLKLKWAKKLLAAKFFVVMTNKESAIAYEGVDPRSFTDVLALTAQAAELQEFYEQLGVLVKEHETAIEALTGGDDAKPKTATTRSKKPRTAKSTRKPTR